MAERSNSDVYKTTDEVQETFLDFFMSKGYTHHPDSGIIPQNDPTLLLINSGMAPMKPFFTGEATPPAEQLTNVQNCIRTGDLDDVGDSHHGTSFNMMGSWQFGGAFSKERATELAYELITNGFGLDPDKLSASVLDDSAEGIPADEESIKAWQRLMPADRIVPLPAADNLWGPAGTSGPCGPCTEVFFDRGPEYADADDVNERLRSGQHIEIWNAGVFMEYLKDEDGTISQLASPSVDGGAGLERFAMVLQGAPSIHEIDRWKPAYDQIFSDVNDVRAARIVTDHLRTSEILLQSGVMPGNRLAPYVLRRLIRRTASVVANSGTDLSSIGEYQDTIQGQLPVVPGTMRSEAETKEALRAELAIFSKVLARADKLLIPFVNRGEISGGDVQQLHSTHGIPADLVRAVCERNGMVFPEEEYEAARQAHAAKS
ncbi:TPA: hypothetical protein DIV49_02380 [Candidatus Saccharibacteria bacterium]|nr:hypothetical protein [Candidatus Saccharibacteria bacterium]HRJ91014.1 alanine--tRNA ligase-related protein [Candidatus Saccharibacteria bacterium]